MSEVDNPHTEVVGVRRAVCVGDESKQHVTAMKTAAGDVVESADAMALMDTGRVYFMKPPPGAPAHAVHVATGLPLLIQTRTCEACGERVLFA